MSVTLEEVWALFKETDRLIKELREQSKETDRRFQETDRRFQETDRRFQETDRRFQETNRELKETIQSLREENEKALRAVQEVSRQLGKLGNRLGEFVEHLVAPALVGLFRDRGLDVQEVHHEVTAQRGGEGIEIDLLVVDNEVLVAVECKSKLALEHVDEHLERMGKLKRLLPAYRDYRALGAVAAMVVPKDVAQYAMAQGLYVLAQSGDTVVLQNDAGFEPRVW